MANTTSNGTACDIHILLPPDKRRWYIFLAISAVWYVIGIIVIGIGRILTHAHAVAKKRQERNNAKYKNADAGERGWYLKLNNLAGSIESGKNIPGKILVSCELKLRYVLHG